MLKVLFSTRGRMGNVAYALCQLGLMPLLSGFSAGREALMAGRLSPIGSVPLVMLGFVLVWISFAVLAKRMHDAGLSAWWWGVPVAAAFFFRPFLYAATLGLAFVAGDGGDNRFGRSPHDWRGWQLKARLRRLGRDFVRERIDVPGYNKTRADLIGVYLSPSG